MQTAALSQDFPETAQAFWADKPDEISPWSWLFHPLNPYRFSLWVAKLLNRIGYYSRLKSFTWFFQRTIAGWLGVTEQWLRTILNRLKVIGVIVDRKVGRNRQYQIVAGVLDQQPKEPSFGESFGIPEEKLPVTNAKEIVSGDVSNFDIKHHDQLTRSIVSIIKSDDEKSDPIVQTFEETTGTTFQSSRDTAALIQLRQYPQLAVIVGIMMSRLRVPDVKINSLAYCIPAVKEVIKAQSTTIKNEINGTSIAHSFILSDGSLTEYARYLRKKLAKLQQA